MKTYVFSVEVEQEEDGRWSATIPALPGCYSWGYTKKEAIESLRDTVHKWLEVLKEKGQPLPKEAKAVKVLPAPTVTVTV